DLLSDYLENTISLPLRAAVDGHVASCVRCAAVLADVRSIVDRAAALPALKPSHDLWSGIEARLDSPVVPITAAASSRRFRVPTWIGLAAAAAVLIVATSVLTRQWVTSGGKEAPSVAITPSQPIARPESLGTESTAVAPVTPVRTAVSRERVSAAVTYGREIARLEAFVRQRGDSLDPTTKAIIENSMRIIDSALVEARAALARDPASRFLTDQVDQTLQKKMELLRTVTLLAART
ncbi:MAG: zf-HC2 domain-containing protein, partial [Gemmatimonadaceae bacterium]